MPDNHLQGRVAVVTGGGVGIGHAIANALAAAGARVVITYRSHEPDAQALAALTASGGETALAQPLPSVRAMSWRSTPVRRAMSDAAAAAISNGSAAGSSRGLLYESDMDPTLGNPAGVRTERPG